MLRFVRRHALTAIDRFRRWQAVHENGVRRVAIVTVGALSAVLLLPLFVPAWQSDLARTYCYPFVGPVQRFAPDLSDSLLARVRAHEDVHAQQCERNGSLWHFISRLSPRQRLVSEAEAYCAEAQFGVAHGGDARLVYLRALDELREIRWFQRLATAELEHALASQCPGIAAQAAREEAEWHARRARRRST